MSADAEARLSDARQILVRAGLEVEVAATGLAGEILALRLDPERWAAWRDAHPGDAGPLLAALRAAGFRHVALHLAAAAPEAA